MRFFLVFFLLYGGIQSYVAHAVDDGLALTGPARLLVWLIALSMTFSPLLLWRLDRNPAARSLSVAVAWIVFAWMGYAFLFFWLGSTLNFYDCVAGLAGLPAFTPRHALLALSTAVLAIWSYGFHSARHPRVERVSIHSGKLPSDAPGLRIALISDVHLGMLIGMRRLEHILKQVELLQPDVLISGGDLVDAQAHHLDGLSARLAMCQPRLGKFAVTGNHERYAGLDHALEFHRRAGFTLLRGESIEVGDIVVAGVDDPAVGAGPGDETQLLGEIPADRFVLLLKHQPRIVGEARFDLQLSGHTHKGQIFPFGLLVKRVYPMIEGLHALADGRKLYVSRGTGTWGPPIRVLAPPEITLIELKGAPQSGP
jgi:hypothetical protein